jgi:hypothetical protein
MRLPGECSDAWIRVKEMKTIFWKRKTQIRARYSSGKFTSTISEEGILKSNENIVKFRTTKMNFLTGDDHAGTTVNRILIS